jgi:N6-L-threonylcarbamoyladenine synthase
MEYPSKNRFGESTLSAKVFVLGIESSCDETAAAVVVNDKRILSNVIYSQMTEHASFGGVVPEVAARAHLEKIDEVVAKALEDAHLNIGEISAVAGVAGPGLIGGVMVGATFAKSIAMCRGIPFVAVNHLEAHALSVRLTENLDFPYLLLLASGGHCQICVVHSAKVFDVLGRTLDDSVGESFDKTSKMLGFGYPGGPALEHKVRDGDDSKFALPRPLFNKNSCDFSFSGLKTAVRIARDKYCNSDQDKIDLGASFQRAATDVLVYKMGSALDICRQKSIRITAAAIAGGVAANKVIRNALKNVCEEKKIAFLAPPIDLCTDNAAMVAWTGIEKLAVWQQPSGLDFAPNPRWPMGA